MLIITRSTEQTFTVLAPDADHKFIVEVIDPGYADLTVLTTRGGLPSTRRLRLRIGVIQKDVFPEISLRFNERDGSNRGRFAIFAPRDFRIFRDDIIRTH